MTRGVWSISAGLAALLLAGGAQARCTEDADCRDDTVCRNGRCVRLALPPQLTAPRPARPPRLTAPPQPRQQPEPGTPPVTPPPAHPPGTPPRPTPLAAPPAPPAYPAHPGPAHPPVQPPPARTVRRIEEPTDRFDTLYGTLSAGILFTPVGDITFTGNGTEAEGRVRSRIAGGLHASAYYMLGRFLHVGGFASWVGGPHTIKDAGLAESSRMGHEFGVGLTAKCGFFVARPLWLGGALDAGAAILKLPDLDSVSAGLLLYPRVVADLFVGSAESMKVALQMAAGATVVPYLAGTTEKGGVKTRYEGWLVRFAITAGFSLGW